MVGFPSSREMGVSGGAFPSSRGCRSSLESISVAGFHPLDRDYLKRSGWFGNPRPPLLAQSLLEVGFHSLDALVVGVREVGLSAAILLAISITVSASVKWLMTLIPLSTASWENLDELLQPLQLVLWSASWGLATANTVSSAVVPPLEAGPQRVLFLPEHW